MPSRAAAKRELAALMLTMAGLVSVAPAIAVTPAETKLWITDGPVYAELQQDALVYIGGDFSYVGPNTGFGATVTSGSGSLTGETAHISNGNGIYTVISDASGGWYVGGDFTVAATKERAYLVHLKSDGSLDEAFAPAPNGPVRALALDVVNADKILYVGGDFTIIGAQTEPSRPARTYLAALKLVDGSATDFAPNLNNAVYTLQLNALATTLYAGGSFTSVGGNTAIHGVVAFAANGSIAWDTPANAAIDTGAVNTTVLDETNKLLYIGGSFTQVNGATRRGVAAIATTTAIPTSFDPNVNGTVEALALDTGKNKLYIAGTFSDIGSNTTLRNLGRVNTDGTLDTAWTPAPNNTVHALAFTATTNISRIVIGGEFTQVYGSDKSYLAAIEIGGTSNTLTNTWGGRVLDSVYALAYGGDTTYVGGKFRSMGGVTRYKLAALNASTGAASIFFAPSNEAPKFVDGAVRSLALTKDGSALYVAGDFTTINMTTNTGTTRNRLARFDTGNSSLYDWNPNIGSGTVSNMVLERNSTDIQVLEMDPANSQVIYAGSADGLYKSTDGGTHWSAINTGLTNTDVRTLVIDPNNGQHLYVGTWGGGVFRSGDGGANWTAFNDGLDNKNIYALTIAANSQALYLGTQVVTPNNSGLLIRKVTNGDWEKTWTLVQSAEAHNFAIEPTDPNIVYLGTTLGTVKWDTTKPSDQALEEFYQGLGDTNITALRASTIPMVGSTSATLYATAGSYVYKSRRANLLNAAKAEVKDENGNPIPTTEWFPIRGLDATALPGVVITAMAFNRSNPSTIYVATAGRGIFKTTNGDATTNNDVQWTQVNTGLPIGRVKSLLQSNSDTSTLFAGTQLGFLFRTTDAGANWAESQQGIDADKLFIAGDFTAGGHPAYLAAVSTSTSPSDYFLAWNAASTAPVKSIALSKDNSTLFAGGSFTSIGGSSHFRVVALNTTTARAVSWSPSVDDGEVRALSLNSDDSLLYIGGTFTSVNNQTRNRIAALDVGDGSVTNWDPNSDNDVNALVVANYDNIVIAGGNFTNIGGEARRYLAGLWTGENSGMAKAWRPNPDQPITGPNALFVAESDDSLALSIGGNFDLIGAINSPNLVRYNFILPILKVSPTPQAYDKAQTITLSCDETNGPTCAKTYYSTDANPSPASFQLYQAYNQQNISTKPVISTTTTLTVYAQDDQAIRSANKTYNYAIDLNAPTVEVTIPSGTYDSTQVLNFVCTDGESSDTSQSKCFATFYTTDGSAPNYQKTTNAVTGLFTYNPIKPTRIYHHIKSTADQKADIVPVRIDTTLRYLAVDTAGNESVEQSAIYVIDRTVNAGGMDLAALATLFSLFLARLGLASRHRNYSNAK